MRSNLTKMYFSPLMLVIVLQIVRVGLPANIGELYTDDARWINAQRIKVSGGMNV
jgi:hypothetical protein